MPAPASRPAVNLGLPEKTMTAKTTQNLGQAYNRRTEYATSAYAFIQQANPLKWLNFYAHSRVHRRNVGKAGDHRAA